MTHRQRLRAPAIGVLTFTMLAAMVLLGAPPASAIFGTAQIDPIESDLATKAWVSVDASSGQSSAANAIDQDPATAWIADVQQPGESLTLDLGGTYSNVRKVEVVFPDVGATYGYLVEASSDGADWTTAVDRTDNGVAGRGNVDLITRPDTRYLRVTITDTSPGATIGISELSAYNYLRDDVILGADLSWVDNDVTQGRSFWVNPGDPNDPGPHLLDVVQDRGMEYIRLRIFNEPRNENSAGTLVNPPFQGPARSAEVATWIVDRGMGLGIDFHYADSWADPGKQPKPRAWAELPFDDLVDALYDYTYDYIQLLIDQGTPPDKVAVGNEVINGFLYGSEASIIGTTNPAYFSSQAHIYQSQPGGGLLWTYWGSDDPVQQQLYDEAWDRFTTLSASGIRAVRDVSADNDVDIEVETHVIIDNQRLAKTVEFWDQYLSRVNAKGEDIDVMAHSYYPEWHGSPDHFEFNLHAVAAAYPGYKLDIAETSYPASGGGGSPLPNSPYPRTIQGQADAIQHVFRIASDLPDDRGVGVLTWEPVRWQTMFRSLGGNTWEPNASIDVYSRSRAETVLEHALYRTGIIGEPLALPDTVRLLSTSDGAVDEVAVDWDLPAGATDVPGRLTVAGTTEHGQVSAHVDVVYGFGGFAPPTAGLPDVSVANAGRAIPIRFTIPGGHDLDLLDPSTPTRQEVDCDTAARLGEPVALPLNEAPSYDPSDDSYHLVWKSERALAGTCQDVIVSLTDGTQHRARFVLR